MLPIMKPIRALGTMISSALELLSSACECAMLYLTFSCLLWNTPEQVQHMLEIIEKDDHRTSKKLGCTKSAPPREDKQKLTMLTHELRTPLNGILGMVTLLQDTPLNTRQTYKVNIIKQCTEQLATVVDNILDQSRIDNSTMNLEKRDFALRSCIEDAFASVAAQAAIDNITFQVNAPGMIKGDYGKLRRVLVNLLSNAVKFTPNGGDIKVDADVHPLPSGACSVHFVVHDHGIGIAPEHINTLFEMFSHIDSSITRKFGGTGLGLAISKSLVELMNGSIWCESELGKGSAFHFTIEGSEADNNVTTTITIPPLLPPQEKPQEPTTTAPDPSEPAGAHLHRSASASATASTAHATLETLLSGQSSPRILIVDDNSLNQRVMKRLLENMGCNNLELAVDGADALSKVQTNRDHSPFDIILMDIEMPVMDGVTSTTRICALPNLQKLPHIVAVTAKERETSYFESGMQGYIRKPIKKEDIMHVLQAYAASQQRQATQPRRRSM